MAGITSYIRAKLSACCTARERDGGLTQVGEQQRDPINPRVKLKNGMASARRKDKIVSPIVDDLARVYQ